MRQLNNSKENKLVLSLGDFQAPRMTLQDFEGQLSYGKTPNERTAKVVAASKAAITGAQRETYEQTKSRLLDPEAQDTFTIEQQQIRDAMWRDFVEPGIPDLIADPNIEVEAKDQLVEAAVRGARMPMSTMSTLAFQAARADMDINATEAAEQARYKFIDSIQRVNDDKRKRQAAINSLHLGRDQSAVGSFVDIAEIMTPFAEWINIDKLQKAAQGGEQPWYQASEGFLLGQQKQALYEQIRALPMSERQAFTEKLLEVVQENKQVILPDGNDMVALETLNRMLIDNDYSNFERWFDNATSILDIAGLGGILRGATKGGRAARGVTTLEQEAEAFVRRPPEDLGPLAREAEEFTPPVEDLGALGEEAAAFKPVVEPTGPLGVEAKSYTPASEPLTPLAKEAQEFKSTPDPTEEDLFGAMAETTRTDVAPTAPSQVVKDVNPTVAREMHEAVMVDETGEVAEALYGTNKTEAVAKDILPEPDIKQGKLPNKVEMKPQFEEPETVKRARLANGNTAVQESEWAKLKSRLVTSLENVEGMALHPSSLLVRTNLDGTIGMTARYSPVDSGFTTWQEAVENAKFAFRQYGLQENSFTLLARKGEDWVETSPKDAEAVSLLKAAGAKGDGFDDIDYAIGLKYDYRFRPEDLEVDELINSSSGIVARAAQFVDTITGDYLAKRGQGSFVQNALPPASVIHPQIVNPGHVASDRVIGLKNLYTELFENFSKQYSKLPKDRRTLMTDYIHEANLEGIPLSVTDLYNRGFSEKEINLLKEWRKANDAMWYATNDDMVKTLRAKGFKVFTHKDSNTLLMGKPIKRGAVGPNSELFDVVENTNVRLTSEELDQLYQAGGEVMKLDEPIFLDGKWVDMVKVRNTPQGGYTRAIYDGEVVMPYRDGYYPVMYDANYFIEKIVRTSDGEKAKVVASARDSGELQQALRMLRAAEPDAKFTSRKDRRLGRDEIFDEGSWSHVTNSGMSAQRVRGERLGDAGSNLHKMGHAHLKDPLEAVANQIYQVSQRVAMRTYMETVKSRWMQNYAPYLDLPKNKFGQTEFPKNISDLKAKEGTSPRVLADAKTNFNYLYSLQNGYINGIDDLYRGVMHSFADFLGERGWYKGQKALFEGAKGSPSRAAKNLAFKMFISMNPARQGIIQRGQMLQLMVINPKYAVSGMVQDLFNIRLVRMGISKDPKYKALYEEIKDQGVLEAVDAHVLIREDAMRLADMTFYQKATSTATKPIDFMQRFGFDAAEQDVLLSAWLAFRDLAIKAGKDVKSQRVKDEILGQARAYTGGMNRAGDMAYSQNTFGIFTQFLSFRHKMLLQPLTDKNLSLLDKTKLTAYTVAMFGPDAALVSYLVHSIYGGQPSPERDVIEAGMLDVFLNKALTVISGKEQAIDWGDFAPSEAYGMGNVLVGMWTTNLGEMIANSPSGSLLFGANPRLNDAFKTAARYFNVTDDYEDPELQTKFTDVVTAFASLASGYSNAFKARYAYHTGKKMSSAGNISDEDVTGLEAYLASLGFQTKTEVGYRKTYEEIYGSNYSKKGGGMEADVQEWYKELKRQLARRGTTTIEDDISMRVLSEAWRVFGEERPAAMEIVMNEMQKDARNGDYSMVQNIINKMNIMTEEELWKVINKLPAGDVRDQLVIVMNAREETDGN